MTTATAAPPLGFVVADLRIGPAGGRGIPVTAELTDADGLVIAPRVQALPDMWGPVHFLGGFGLLHVESGALVRTGHTAAPALREIARRVAHLDWTAPDSGQYGVEGSPWRVAVQDADAEVAR